MGLELTRRLATGAESAHIQGARKAPDLCY